MGSSGLVESGSGRARGRSSRARGLGPSAHDDSPWGSGPGRGWGRAAEGAPVPAGPVGCARSPGQGPDCVEGALDLAEARVTSVRAEPRGAGTCTDAMARCRSPDVVDEHEAM